MAKFKKEYIVYIIGAILLMSFLPGDGWKMAGKKEAIATSDYECVLDTDCPKCLGYGWFTYNESLRDDFHLGEFSFSECNVPEGKCDLSEYCVMWQCGATQQNCTSVKQTILDNTLGRLNENPIYILAIIGLIIAMVML